jgi:NAD(P)-dependent dehydrogenase (short-subunit alcohol dehydrogenase family)
VGRLEGKIALITGGHSGIGRATARQFVNEGAYVFITGRRKAELAAAVKEIGRNASGVQGDVSNLADLDRLFAQIKKEKGKLDIVFANAGSSGTAFCTVNCPTAPQSSSMRRGEQGTGPYSVYSATKAAVRSFARTWTTDLKDRRIRVNAISPGSIDTPAATDLLASSEVGAQRKQMIPTVVPLGRFDTR